MKRKTFVIASILTLLLAGLGNIGPGAGPAAAATADELNSAAVSALENLTAKSPAARDLSQQAVAILVFPGIYKAGLMIGAQRGEGVLLVNGQPQGYYRTSGGSYGLQAGAQKYGYALMFMTRDALDYLERSSGWEIGVGPSVVVVDEGMGKSMTTTTAKQDVYAFIFGQKGLMAGIGLQGNKITKINKR